MSVASAHKIPANTALVLRELNHEISTNGKRGALRRTGDKFGISDSRVAQIRDAVLAPRVREHPVCLDGEPTNLADPGSQLVDVLVYVPPPGALYFMPRERLDPLLEALIMSPLPVVSLAKLEQRQVAHVQLAHYRAHRLPSTYDPVAEYLKAHPRKRRRRLSPADVAVLAFAGLGTLFLVVLLLTRSATLSGLLGALLVALAREASWHQRRERRCST